MVEQSSLEYATAAGNDYAAHEGNYTRFVHAVFVGMIHVVNVLLGLAMGGVMGHWFIGLGMFIVAVAGAIPGFVSGTKMTSYIALIICFVIFALVGAAS